MLNQVQREFNGLGQLTTEYQDHSGKATTSSPKVQYAYDAGNGSRLTGMTYPNGRVLLYDYGTVNGLNDQIGRVEGLEESGTSQPLERYAYLGLGTIVERAHGEPGVNLTYVSGTAGDAGDQYAGLDRFGRVVDQRWVKTSTHVK